MRTLLAFVLLGTASAHDCPIIDWLKHHGADAFDTIVECKDVPGLIKKSRESQCKAKSEPMDRVALGLWYAITGLEHMNGTIPDMVQHSEVIAKVKSFAVEKLLSHAHDALSYGCEHDQCKALSKKLQAIVSPCYSSLACNFMTSVLPFGACKDAFEKYMESVMQIVMGSMCDKEELAGGSYYCAQLSSELMFRDIDCFIEMKQTSGVLAKCTPRCVKLWEGTKDKLPKCSKEFNGMTQKIYESMLTLLKDMSKSATIPMNIDHMPKSLPSYDDICVHPPETITI